MSAPEVRAARGEEAAALTRQYVDALRSRGPAVDAAWPWQEPPEAWVNHLLTLAAQPDVQELYVDPLAGGGAALRLRVDGVVLPGPLFSSEQHDRLMGEIQRRATLTSPSSARPLSDGLISVSPEQVVRVHWVGLLETAAGRQLTLRARRPLPNEVALDKWPLQARAALEQMRRHPEGVTVFCNRGWSVRRGLMFRVLDVWAREVHPEARFACVTDAPQVIPPREWVADVRLDGTGDAWEATLRSLEMQGFDVLALAGREELEVATQAFLTSLQAHSVLVNVSRRDVWETLWWLLTALRVEPDQIAQELVGVVGEQQIRRVCPHCASSEPPDEAALAVIHDRGIPALAPERWIRGQGCEACHGTGFSPRERLDLVEAIYVDRALAALCASRPDPAAVQSALAERGFQTYFEQAIHLANQGLTSIQEAIAVGLARRADL